MNERGSGVRGRLDHQLLMWLPTLRAQGGEPFSHDSFILSLSLTAMGIWDEITCRRGRRRMLHMFQDHREFLRARTTKALKKSSRRRKPLAFPIKSLPTRPKCSRTTTSPRLWANCSWRTLRPRSSLRAIVLAAPLRLCIPPCCTGTGKTRWPAKSPQCTRSDSLALATRISRTTRPENYATSITVSSIAMTWCRGCLLIMRSSPSSISATAPTSIACTMEW